MWFQTLLLASLSLAQYGKTIVSFFGKCNRSMRLHRPATLYVRVNSIEGMWLAAFLKTQHLAKEVYLVEETMIKKDYQVHEDDFTLVDAAFRSVNVDIEWQDIPKKKKDSIEKKEEWAMFTSAPNTNKEEEDEETEDLLQPVEGWTRLSRRFRDQVDRYESHLPDHQLMYVVDAREPEETKCDFVPILRQALRIIGVLPIELDVLKMDYLFESMCLAQTDEEKDEQTEEEENEDDEDEEEEEQTECVKVL
tara:strand:- start:15 stop:764 length:750 start_codon:yes stop_codon:yes gene_type:complete